MKKKNYCLISHTHWDREWYLPFENFRMRLVDLIDHLLEILDTDPEYRFHLDAQTIVLDDYLEIRPYKKDILKKYITEGRILVGPWYVQNDFHLTDGESTVRNLIIGKTMAGKFGASMPIGYAADQFGLISQLPQILVRSGLDTCVFGRGFDRGVTEFYWESEDGSSLLAEHMKFWYNNAQRLSPVPEGALRLIRERGAACAAHCAGSSYLLMNGVDHLEAQEDLTEIINKLRPMLNEDECLFQDTLPEFMQRLKDEIAENGLELKHFTGEFRDNGADSVLTGTLSSRIYLKQANALAEYELERKTEPLWSLISAAGIDDYPKDYLKYLWKLLISNHPHDSICGCSVDAVHEHMMDRFKRIYENTSDLFTRGIDALNSHIASAPDDAGYRVIICNGCGAVNTDVVKAVIDIPENDDLGGIEIYDEQGKPLQFFIDEYRKNIERPVLSPINLPGSIKVNRYFVTIDAGATEGYTYRVLKVTSVNPVSDSFSPENNNVLENDYIKAEINFDGTVRLTDKRSGIVRDGILYFEDTADRGDSYNYSAGDTAGTVITRGQPATVRTVESTPLRKSISVNRRITAERAEGCGYTDIEMLLTLSKYSEALDVELNIDNRLENHRLRVLVPTDIISDTNYASQPYDIIIRDRVSRFRNDREHPSSDFIGIEEDGNGIALLHLGLFEYEHMSDERGTLALTVLRSVGIVSGRWETRDTMSKEWTAPGCQCIGENHAHFAVIPYSGNHITAQVAAKAQLFTSPLMVQSRAVDPNRFIGGRPFVQGAGMPDLFYRPIKNEDKKLPSKGTFVKIESDNSCIIETALKKAENGCGYIVRIYNTTSEKQGFVLSSPLFGINHAERLQLTEDGNAEEINIADGKISCTAKPKEIITFRIS